MICPYHPNGCPIDWDLDHSNSDPHNLWIDIPGMGLAVHIGITEDATEVSLHTTDNETRVPVEQVAAIEAPSNAPRLCEDCGDVHQPSRQHRHPDWPGPAIG